jgi:hypothetical protein
MKIFFNFIFILFFSVITLSGAYSIGTENKNVVLLDFSNNIADFSSKINQRTDTIQIIYNPERDHIKITLSISGLSENNQWLFIQPSGDVYKQGKINSLGKGMYQITINTKPLQSGEYTFEIKDYDLVISKKIAILK